MHGKVPRNFHVDQAIDAQGSQKSSDRSGAGVSIFRGSIMGPFILQYLGMLYSQTS